MRRNGRSAASVTAVLFALVLAFGAGPARAADLADFLAETGAAYEHYRQTMFYLRTGNPAVAEFDLQLMRDKWAALEETYAADPPAPFSADPGFAATVSAVARAIDGGIANVATEDAEAARAALAPIRGLLGDLRRRNGLYTLSDCVDEFSASAEALWVYRHAPPDFADPEAVNGLRRAAAVAGFLLGRCRAMAAPAHGAAEEFQALFDGAKASASSLWPAIDAGDTQRVINILREFRSFDQMIYLRYG
ncbi:MAG: hypothetical protein HKM95_16270 [Inquilinus sp.]|nr:hypothetical protein [Inquilinus sp.]